MPFGAEVREDGTTRFRLWAPAAEIVELWLEDHARALPMARDAGGWVELVTREAPPGTRYQFRIDGELLVPDPASRFQPEEQSLAFHRTLLSVREKEIAPLLAGEPTPRAQWSAIGETSLEAEWTLPGEQVLRLIANLGPAPAAHGGPAPDWGRRLYGLGLPGPRWEVLPPWSVGWFLWEPDR
jgi:hypothetical protein